MAHGTLTGTNNHQFDRCAAIPCQCVAPATAMPPHEADVDPSLKRMDPSLNQMWTRVLSGCGPESKSDVDPSLGVVVDVSLDSEV